MPWHKGVSLPCSSLRRKAAVLNDMPWVAYGSRVGV
jgi:hypothetical protein